MRFDVNLAGGIDSWALQVAGLEAEGWDKLVLASSDARKLPKTLRCRYCPDDSVKTSLTIFSFGGHDDIDRWYDQSGGLAFKRIAKAKHPTRVQIEIDDAKAGRAVQKTLELYSYENDGELAWWKGLAEACKKFDAILARDELSLQKLNRGEGPMSRASVEALIKLAAKLEPGRQDNIQNLFSNRNVAKKDWPIAVGWLVEEFERNRKMDDQLSTRIYEVTVPAIAEQLIRFIKDPKFGNKRWPLCLALAKTKHPQAADTIASVLGQGVNTRGALEALAKLPAHAHVETIRKYLRDSNSDVRMQAKKTLAKLGVKTEEAPPPAPVHLVTGKQSPPRGLEEWSANLEVDEVGPTLKKLAKAIDRGFGDTEIAEVIGIAEQMRVNQTKTFRFPVTAGGKKSDVWIVVFMDDIDSPDLAIHAQPAIIRRFAKQVDSG